MRRSPARFLMWLCATTVVAGAVSCGTSGRELRPPEPDAVQPTRSTAAPTASVTTATTQPAAAMTLTSPAFTAGTPIPARYSCEGPSPALSWSNVPPGTAELVLAVIDLDANGFMHWLVSGIAPKDGGVAEGAVPEGGRQLPNGRGTDGWFGPCPPAGTTHTYNFVLLAMPEGSSVPAGSNPTDIFAQLQSGAGGSTARLAGTFRREG